MKNFKINYLRLFTLAFTFLLLSGIFLESTVEAAILAGGRKNNAKPSVYYDASVANFGYTARYDAGRAYWNSHTLVDLIKTTSYNNRPDIYYIGNTTITGLYGKITPYTSDYLVAPEGGYWDYATVIMYDNQMRATGSFTNARINYNAAHEIGHTIKMAHVSLPTNSVMVQGWRDIPASLTSFDSGEITKKW